MIAQTDLKLYEGEDWYPMGAPITVELRRIGWIDQKGRVWQHWQDRPQPFDGGSATPLLIPVDREG